MEIYVSASTKQILNTYNCYNILDTILTLNKYHNYYKENNNFLWKYTKGTITYTSDVNEDTNTFDKVFTDTPFIENFIFHFIALDNGDYVIVNSFEYIDI